MRAKSSIFAAIAAMLMIGIAVASAVGPATQGASLRTASDSIHA